MGRTALLPTVLAVAGLELAAAAALGEPRFRPATLPGGEGSFTQRLECPESGPRETPVVIFCNLKIDEEGDAYDPTCFALERGTFDYVRNTRRAMRGTKFQPARVDGDPVPVALSMRVIFRWKDQVCQRFTVMNPGEQADELGLAYIAPQEIVDEGGWWFRSRQLGRGPEDRGGPAKTGIMFVMSVAVTKDGVASDPRIDRNVYAQRSELAAARRGLSKSRFIPGFIDGRPHAMRHFEIFYVR